MVDVLLPLHNGARYLPDLLTSLEAQTRSSWNLLVRDDASSDASTALVKERAIAACSLHRGDHVGVVRGMNWLLENSASPYFMPADQDDIWLPEKMATLLDAVQAMEQAWGTDTPILAFCDLELVDANGKSQGTTFRRQYGFPDDWETKFQSILIMSGAPGCAMLGNAALRKCALPLPDENRIFMHDWWLLLCAAALGKVVYVPKPLVLYRQHEHNALGARPVFSFAEPGAKLAAMRQAVLRTQQQAGALLDRHGARMNTAHAGMCERWAAMPGVSRIRRWAGALAMGAAKPGIFRNLAFYAAL